MNRKEKKGFTIVELVIVIAVIAVLAAILIPTFANLINRANLSADMQAVRLMNQQLAIAEASEEKPAGVLEAQAVMKRSGYNVPGYQPISTGYKVYWLSEENRVVLYHQAEGKVVYPDEYQDYEYDGDTWYDILYVLTDVTVNDSGVITGISNKTDEYVVIPASYNGVPVTAIQLDDYSQINLTTKKIIVEKGVKIVGSRAFQNFQALESITLPEGITTIGEGAFALCKNLKSITLPEGLTVLGANKAVNGGVDTCAGVFHGCTALEEITLPSTVTVLGDFAFNYCPSLKKVNIPEGVRYVGESSFAFCSALEELVLPASLEAIGNEAFKACDSLKTMVFPASVTAIGNRAFQGCTSLTEITIPETVTYFGANVSYFKVDSENQYGVDGRVKVGVFEGCTALTHVIINGYYNLSEDYVDPDSGIVYPGQRQIPAYTFKGCTALTSVSIGKKVTEIGEYAFTGCTSLVSVTIPKNVNRLYSSAFSGCTALSSVTIATNEEGEAWFYRNVKVDEMSQSDTEIANYLKNQTNSRALTRKAS